MFPCMKVCLGIAKTGILSNCHTIRLALYQDNFRVRQLNSPTAPSPTTTHLMACISAEDWQEKLSLRYSHFLSSSPDFSFVRPTSRAVTMTFTGTNLTPAAAPRARGKGKKAAFPLSPRDYDVLRVSTYKLKRRQVLPSGMIHRIGCLTGLDTKMLHVDVLLIGFIYLRPLINASRSAFAEIITFTAAALLLCSFLSPPRLDYCLTLRRRRHFDRRDEFIIELCGSPGHVGKSDAVHYLTPDFGAPKGDFQIVVQLI